MSDKSSTFDELYAIVKKLRDPEGCPWDRKQTPESLKAFLLEEVYECFEAIDDKDGEHLKEELGDVFMLATMIAYIMEQKGVFRVHEVLSEVNAKLIRRHPHVFGDIELSTSEEVVRQWDDIKVNVEGRNHEKSILEKVPKNLPPLERAHKLQQRCAQVGFDWTDADDVWEKVNEEMREVREAISAANLDDPPDTTAFAEREIELGDLFFAVVNLSRFLKVDPAAALHRANSKFSRRFTYVERQMNSLGLKLAPENMPKMDAFWDEAKRSEHEDADRPTGL